MSTSIVETMRGEMTSDQVELVRRTLCVGASDDELAMFLQQCRRTGLDPFSRQIYAIKRWNRSAGREVMATQVSIDGFRLIAERTGKYCGQLGPWWCGKDGVWKEVWTENNPPIASKVGILRNDFKEPIYAVARYASYVQTTREGNANAMWSKMFDVMTAKCAEALGLRKAFPQELSGLYTPDEMGQDDEHQKPEANGKHASLPAPQSEPTDSTPVKQSEAKTEQVDASKILSTWKECLGFCKTADDLNSGETRAFYVKIPSMAKREAWKMLADRAEELDCVWNQERNSWGPAAAVPQEQSQEDHGEEEPPT